MEKTCSACQLPFPVATGFYRHKLTADGYTPECKGCVKARVARNYAKTRKRKSAYDARRNQSAARKASRADHQRRYRERHPDRCKARAAVNNAIASGKLTRQPCACGSTRRVQAHHHDYSKPLDVTWLCFKCHRQHAHGQVVTSPDDGRA